jgi:hypothetical protein
MDVQGDEHDTRIGALETALADLFSSAQTGPSSGRPTPTPGKLYIDTDLPALLVGTGADWLKVDLTALTGDGAASAPQNFAGVVAAGGSIGQITLTWDLVAGASAVTVRESRSPGGVSGMPLSGTAVSSIRTPSTPGGYDYWVTATVGDETAESNHFTCTLPFSGTVGTPAEILDIGSGATQNHFNVGIGYSGGHPGPNGETVHKDWKLSEIIAGFADTPFCTPNTGGTAVECTMFADGSYTSPVNPTTHHPRVEFRELYPDDAHKAAWNAGSGTHIMVGRTKITHLPADAESTSSPRPWICFAQIHDNLGDVIRLQVEGTINGGLKIKSRTHTPNGDASETTTELQSSYSVGDTIDWEIRAIDATVTIYIGGVLKKTVTGVTATGCYFKAGNYQQFSTLSTDGGYAASSYSTVELSNLDVTHS